MRMLKELPDLIPQSVKYKIERSQHARLQKIVLNQMGLTNLNHLRDRFEGQAYLDRFLMRAFAELALDRLFNDKGSYLELKEEDMNYKPVFKIGSRTVEVAFSRVDSYPLIPKGDYDILAVVFISLLNLQTQVVGFVSREDLAMNTDIGSITPIEARNYEGRLKNLKILSPLDAFKAVI